MSDRRLLVALVFLAGLAVVAGAAPGLGFRDPDAQPDGLVLRDLPPFSRVDAILLADGSTRYADEISVLPGGGVRYRRGRTEKTLEADELAGRSQDDWHRRPVFLLGTDGFGRDLASRLVYGARIALSVGVLSALVGLFLGGGIGLAAGFAGGWVDAVLMRFADMLLAIPRLFLLLFLIALYSSSIATTILVLGMTAWMVPARLVRGEVLSLREREYVQAARSAGAPGWRVALVHLLPGAMAPLLVEGALRVANTILLESSLSFLGKGVPPPTASWGNIIADGRDSLLDAWWISTLPGLAIAATVIALTLVGDALRDRLDPNSPSN